MKIGLVGFNYVDLTEFQLSFLSEASELVLIGSANKKLEKQIKSLKIPINELPANYRKYKKEASLRQNLDLIEVCDKIILFWNIDMSPNMLLIKNCIKQNKPIIIFPSIAD